MLQEPMHISKLSIFFFFLLLLCRHSSVSGQAGYFHSGFTAEDTLDDDDDLDFFDDEDSDLTPHNYLSLGTEYGSNFTYQGRSLGRNPYFMPSIGYMAKSGFYALAGAYDVKGLDVGSAWEEKDLLAGWSFRLTKKLKGDVSFGKSFFDRKNDVLKAALGNDLGLGLKYDFKWFDSRISYDYLFQRFRRNTKKRILFHDSYLSWENYHEFAWYDLLKEDDEFDIEPDFTIMGGTDNFLAQVLENSPKLKARASAKAVQRVQNASRFGIILYSFSLPVSYCYKNFTLTPSWTFNIDPYGEESSITTANTASTASGTETYSIWRLSLSYDIKVK
jgi:hypothetical protein